MSESKIFMFPEQGNNLMSLVAPLLQQRGIDPNILAVLNNKSTFGGEGGWFMWVIFLFFLMGWGGNGIFGNRGLNDVINNDTGKELLMSAIQGVMAQVQNVGNQVGMSVPQIINAIQAGNCQIASKIADCCCENRLAICQQTNTLQNSINNVATGQERGFSSIAYETQRQTCDIQNSIKEATDAILTGQRNAEIRDLQEKINTLRESNSQKDVIINNGQQTAIFSQMLNPLAQAVNGLQNDINGIKCKLPDTTTIQYSPVVGVPSCLAAQYGLYNWTNNTLWG